MSQFIRRESPPHFDDCQRYRPFLRRDFLQVCAFCERTELSLGGEEFFEIDHFRPEAAFPELRTHYPNLYYACGKCNRHKAYVWPSDSLLAKGYRLADPCEEDMYVEHLRELADGTLEPLTNCGRYTRKQIRLDRPDLLRWRQFRLQIVSDLRTFEEITEQLAALLETATDPADRDAIGEQVALLELTIAHLRQEFSL